MIKTLLLDADGVLINGKHFSVELENKYGISAEQTTPFFLTEFPKCLIGEADLKEKLQSYLRQWGWKKSVDELLNYWFEVEHSVDEALIKHIQNLRAEGIRCVVATNQEKYRSEYMLNQMGFKENFDDFYSSASLGAKKPDLTFFEKLLQKTGIKNKEEVLFWDDATSNVKAAKVFGIHAEHYTTFDDFKKKMDVYDNLGQNL